MEDYSLKDSFPTISHMKILPTEAQSHTMSLFNTLHPTIKTSNKADETLVRNPAAGKKNKWQKNTYYKTWLGNRTLKPITSTLVTH